MALSNGTDSYQCWPDGEGRELRQGTVELLNADGEAVNRCSAPRLRSKW